MGMKKKEWVLIPAMAFLLNGCALDDSARTQLEGTGLGAAVGGALGYMFGGRDGAAIGAVLGGGLGFALGNDIASRKQSYASREDALDGEIAYFSEYNQSVDSANKKLSAEISALKKESKSLMAQYKKGKISRSKVLAQKQSITKAANENKKYLAELDKQHSEGVKYLNNELAGSGVNSGKVAKLRKEQKSLKNKIDEARVLQKQMANIAQGMSV